MLFSRGAANARVFADDHCDDGVARSYIIHARPDELDRGGLLRLVYRRNWNAGVPTAATSANIDTVSPNPTVVATPGGTAQNLAVGQNGTGRLTIQSGGTVSNVLGAVGNLPGSQGTVTVTGAGSTWTNTGNVVVGGLGTGTLTIQNGGTVNSAGGGSVGLAAGSTVR